jgi:hypothetical protein
VSTDEQHSGFIRDEQQRYADLATVASQQDDRIAEEFPEGPYSFSVEAETPGSSSPWHEDQRPANRFTYGNREFHAGISREMSTSHPTHYSNGDDRLDE